MSEFFKRILIATIAIGAIALLPGCSSRTKIDTTVTETSTDNRGNQVTTVTETNTIKAENVSLVEGLAPIMSACIGDIKAEDAEREAKKSLIDVLPPIPDCSQATTASGQSSCYTNNTHMAAYTILGLALEGMQAEDMPQLESPQAFCARQVAAIADGYHNKEAAQAGAWKAFGVAGIIAIPTAWVFSRGIDMVGNMAENQGDTTQTGDINITKSDDPISGEGGSSGYIGGQSVTIGGGKAVSDKGIALDAEKGIGFTGDSNMDADGGNGETGINLDDADGNGNSGRLF